MLDRMQINSLDHLFIYSFIRSLYLLFLLIMVSYVFLFVMHQLLKRYLPIFAGSVYSAVLLLLPVIVKSFRIVVRYILLAD